MHQLRRCIVTVLLAVATTAATAESPHTIRLTRPVEVGHGFHLRATGSVDVATTTVVSGRPQNAATVKLSATLDAVGRVITVDDAGRPVGIAYLINECKMTRHGYTSTIISKGKTLIARQGDKQTKFFVKKTSFTDFERHALETVAGMDTYLATRDQMFGTEQPRNVGEQWPIDPHAVATEFQRYTPQKVKPGDIVGTTVFMELIDFGGTRCQVVRTEITSTGALPGFEEMPRGTRLKSAEINAITYDLLPVDTSLPRSADKVRVEMDIAFAGMQSGQKVEGRAKGVIESEHTFSPITPAHAAVEP